MLPSDLLRTRTSRGRIIPLLCAAHAEETAEYELACKITSEFARAYEQKCTKGELLARVSELESTYDYKLVRGLCTLLERRTTFEMASVGSSSATTPVSIRQTLFAESARVGLATSDEARSAIIQRAADLHGMTSPEISEMMWADLDSNLCMTEFGSISPEDLLMWYNMSLVQTLLFRCTRLEFFIDEGTYWKDVLRAVKMRGLMYTLDVTGRDDDDDNSTIRCTLEGPMSIFKMTDRYGTTFAELFPIITRTPAWEISGSIMKRTPSGKKVYSFEMSSAETRDYIRNILEYRQPSAGAAATYDSTTEQKFAKILYQHFDQNDPLGWRITRESEILVAGHRAMIPDFVFERLGRKVYFEIVGFWTPDYINKKIAKLRELLATYDADGAGNLDLVVAVDSSLPCSQITEMVGRNGVFTFGRDISIRPIIEYLQGIDRIISRDMTAGMPRLDKNDMRAEMLSIRDVALRYMVPEDIVPEVVERSGSKGYVRAGQYMFSAKRTAEISEMLHDTKRFVDACSIMESEGIPDSCHADLLAELGYDVMWPDLNPENATIKRT